MCERSSCTKSRHDPRTVCRSLLCWGLIATLPLGELALPALAETPLSQYRDNALCRSLVGQPRRAEAPLPRCSSVRMSPGCALRPPCFALSPGRTGSFADRTESFTPWTRCRYSAYLFPPPRAPLPLRSDFAYTFKSDAYGATLAISAAMLLLAGIIRAAYIQPELHKYTYGTAHFQIPAVLD